MHTAVLIGLPPGDPPWAVWLKAFLFVFIGALVMAVPFAVGWLDAWLCLAIASGCLVFFFLRAGVKAKEARVPRAAAKAFLDGLANREPANDIEARTLAAQALQAHLVSLGWMERHNGLTQRAQLEALEQRTGLRLPRVIVIDGPKLKEGLAKHFRLPASALDQIGLQHRVIVSTGRTPPLTWILVIGAIVGAVVLAITTGMYPAAIKGIGLVLALVFAGIAAIVRGQGGWWVDLTANDVWLIKRASMGYEISKSKIDAHQSFVIVQSAGAMDGRKRGLLTRILPKPDQTTPVLSIASLDLPLASTPWAGAIRELVEASG